MEKDFLFYKQALELNQLGFDEPCFGYYVELKNPQEGLLKVGLDNDFLQAPTYSQAFRWFREKYNLFGQVNIHTYFIYNISNDGFEMIKQYDKLTNTHEEAQLECLKKLIEMKKVITNR